MHRRSRAGWACVRDRPSWPDRGRRSGRGDRAKSPVAVEVAQRAMGRFENLGVRGRDDPLDLGPDGIRVEGQVDRPAWGRPCRSAAGGDGLDLVRVCADLLLRVARVEGDLTAMNRNLTDRGLADARTMA